MTTIAIAILALAIGIYIGSIVFGHNEPEVKQNKVKLFYPMVRTFEFRSSLTKTKLIDDVLKPCMVEFYHHWYGISEYFTWPENLEQLADRIMQWYSPESGYTELLLVAHSDGNGSFQVDFTWTNPEHMFIVKKETALTVKRDAVEGLEQYYKDFK